MVSSKRFRRCWLPVLLVFALFISPLLAQNTAGTRPTTPNRYGPAAWAQAGTPGQSPAAQRPYRLAERAAPTQPPRLANLSPGQPNEHPLVPTLRWAYEGLGNVEKLEDYSATLVKRERVNGKVGEHEYMFVKIRHRPFSVYMRFLKPPQLKGQEVIYVEGQNNGKMLAHGTGVKQTMFGTLQLVPTGLIAMRGNRYPLTEIGILNLVRRLVEVAEKDIKYGECEVKFFKGAKINNRSCTCIEVVHPVPRRNFLFHVARIFVDEELNVPIRYESYDWPKQPGAPPPLFEEYTYLNLKLNNGFTDADFDTRNPNYRFR